MTLEIWGWRLYGILDLSMSHFIRSSVHVSISYMCVIQNFCNVICIPIDEF
jgi:hypothetical protein